MLAVFLAIALNAFIPTGFMPSFSSVGKVAIVICSGIGEKTVYIDADTTKTDTHGTNKQPCPYFLAHHPVKIDILSVSTIHLVYTSTGFITLTANNPISVHDDIHVPRGPPILA